MQIIKQIKPGSVAEELEILPGSKLLTVNGEEIEDIFDYEFLMADEYVQLEIENPAGEIDLYEIEKDYDEEMGLVFENSLMDEYKSCCNHCVFCFIDQMPPGMRETLYFKDDDSRLSFLQGNYITLTNMKDRDIERIIRYRMSPINISIHTMEPELRCRMLHNRFAGEVLRYLDRLYEAEIRMNGQIVLCRGLNDGEHLRLTLTELIKYAPVMESVSVVPVGLTKYREGLYPLEPLDARDAEAVIDMVEEFQRICVSEFGLHFVHASDEFYLLAGRELPEEERYDGYLQLENGVGMLRLLREEFEAALEERLKEPDSGSKACKSSGRRVRRTIATGQLAYGTVSALTQDALRRLTQKQTDIPEIQCIAVENHFFGERITVSGLVCGCDIIEQLKDRDLGAELLIPVNMMRSGELYFLDDITIPQLEEALHIKAVIVPSDGESLLKALLGETVETGERQTYEQTDRSDSRKT